MGEALLRVNPVLQDCLRKEAKELQVFGRENIVTPEETWRSVKFGLLLLLGASSFARTGQHRLN
jgi:hypothetical protein